MGGVTRYAPIGTHTGTEATRERAIEIHIVEIKRTAESAAGKVCPASICLAVMGSRETIATAQRPATTFLRTKTT